MLWKSGGVVAETWLNLCLNSGRRLALLSPTTRPSRHNRHGHGRQPRQRAGYPLQQYLCRLGGHAYQIGKYEVTAGQYTEFLNAVAKADPNGLYNTTMGDTAIR